MSVMHDWLQNAAESALIWLHTKLKLPFLQMQHSQYLLAPSLVISHHTAWLWQNASVKTAKSADKLHMYMQILLKRDGYVGLQTQETTEDEESEQLLSTIDSPARVSNTIPELANISQITAPNNIDAELHAVPLFTQSQKVSSHDVAAFAQHESSSDAHSDNENADPNQLTQPAAQLELQPVGKLQSPSADQEVHTACFLRKQTPSVACCQFCMGQHSSSSCLTSHLTTHGYLGM